MRNCDVKAMFDTEFEATVKAAQKSALWGEDMEPYKCGSHWHITHTDERLRGTHRPITYCDACHASMKPGRWKKHQQFPGHQRAVIRLQTSTTVTEE